MAQPNTSKSSSKASLVVEDECSEFEGLSTPRKHFDVEGLPTHTSDEQV